MYIYLPKNFTNKVKKSGQTQQRNNEPGKYETNDQNRKSACQNTL